MEYAGSLFTAQSTASINDRELSTTISFDMTETTKAAAAAPATAEAPQKKAVHTKRRRQRKNPLVKVHEQRRLVVEPEEMAAPEKTVRKWLNIWRAVCCSYA